MQDVVSLILEDLLARDAQIHQESKETLLCHVTCGDQAAIFGYLNSGAAIVENTLCKETCGVHAVEVSWPIIENLLHGVELSDSHLILG
jgi:hypothetical protein